MAREACPLRCTMAGGAGLRRSGGVASLQFRAGEIFLETRVAEGRMESG